MYWTLSRARSFAAQARRIPEWARIPVQAAGPLAQPVGRSESDSDTVSHTTVPGTASDTGPRVTLRVGPLSAFMALCAEGGASLIDERAHENLIFLENATDSNPRRI